MLHMRHWYVFLVLLFLPLQWVWAESAACQLKAHVVASYQHARVASHLPVAAGHELHEAPLAGAAVQVDMPRWEFELDEEFDIVEQISEPDWGDVAVDDLVCRPPANDNSYGGAHSTPTSSTFPCASRSPRPSWAIRCSSLCSFPPRRPRCSGPTGRHH